MPILKIAALAIVAVLGTPAAHARGEARRRLFPPAKLRSAESSWMLIIEHSGTALTERDVRNALPRAFQDVPIEPAGAGAPASLRLEHAESPEFAPPGVEELGYFARGLSPAEIQRAAATRRATAISVRSRSGPGATSLLLATEEMAANLAAARGGFIWDATTRQLFTPESLRKQRRGSGPIDVTAHVTMHAYRSGEMIRVITLGMQKFALPDLVIEESTGGVEIGNMINLAAQLLAEGATLSPTSKLLLDLEALRDPGIREHMTGKLFSGAGRKAEVTALEGRRQEGDPENALLELSFGEPAQQRQYQTAALIWGAHDEAFAVRSDAVLEQESRRAREKAIREVKPRFQRGELERQHLQVKLPFHDGTRTEWMWVEVLRWEGSRVSGILRNAPEVVRGFAAGGRVTGEEQDIFDYFLHLPDGGVEGNTTEALLRKHVQPR